MQVTYCRRWNFDRHTPIDPLTLEQAAKRGGDGELYTVTLGEPSKPDRVIEVNWQNDWLGVWFFDPQGRQVLSYGFRRLEPDRLFLEEIVRWQYPDEQAETLSGAELVDSFLYAPDGIAKRVVKDNIAAENRIQERSGVDVMTHWEPVPALGDWRSVIRWDRSKPPLA